MSFGYETSSEALRVCTPSVVDNKYRRGKKPYRRDVKLSMSVMLRVEDVRLMFLVKERSERQLRYQYTVSRRVTPHLSLMTHP